MPITIMVVDDHVVLLDCLHEVLSQHPDLEVVGSVSRIKQAQQYLDEQIAQHLTLPDVYLIDYWLMERHGKDGRYLAQWILSKHPEAKIVLLSADPGENLQPKLEGEGLFGYARKDDGLQVLIDTIRRVAQGEKVWHSRILA